MTERNDHHQNHNKIRITTSLRLKPIAPAPGHECESIQFHHNSSITSFSNIFDSTQSKLQCYSNACSATVDEFLSSQNNCTIFVYGQTGSGKTHTLFGPPNSFHSKVLENANEVFHDVNIVSTWGIFPRIILNILNNKRSLQTTGIKATAVEIYMDNCYDLLRDGQKIAVAGFGRSRKVSGRGSFLDTTEV
jgi:primosomal protein N'